jgi:hypothetical protein
MMDAMRSIGPANTLRINRSGNRLASKVTANPRRKTSSCEGGHDATRRGRCAALGMD